VYVNEIIVGVMTSEMSQLLIMLFCACLLLLIMLIANNMASEESTLRILIENPGHSSYQ